MTSTNTGKVRSVHLRLERGYFLTLSIYIDYEDGGVQSFISPLLNNGNNGHVACGDYILRMFELFDVEDLDDIKGKKVTALFDQNDHWNSTIKGLSVGNRKFWSKDWLHSLQERGLLKTRA